MCMICKGLERNKLSPEEAKEKLEEFVDLDLLDEDHQEQVEMLIAEAESEEFYWEASESEARRRLEDYDEAYDDSFKESQEVVFDDDDPPNE